MKTDPTFFPSMCVPTQTTWPAFSMDCSPLSTVSFSWQILDPFTTLQLSLFWTPTQSVLHHLVRRDAGYTVYLVRAPERDASLQKWAKPSHMNTQMTQLLRNQNTQFPLWAWDGGRLHLGYCKTTGALWNFFAVAIVTSLLRDCILRERCSANMVSAVSFASC